MNIVSNNSTSISQVIEQHTEFAATVGAAIGTTTAIALTLLRELNGRNLLSPLSPKLKNFSFLEHHSYSTTHKICDAIQNLVMLTLGGGIVLGGYGFVGSSLYCLYNYLPAYINRNI